jgi:hypothetical protein
LLSVCSAWGASSGGTTAAVGPFPLLPRRLEPRPGNWPDECVGMQVDVDVVVVLLCYPYDCWGNKDRRIPADHSGLMSVCEGG